jgi:glucose-6-phosphate 1-dehydrogenase
MSSITSTAAGVSVVVPEPLPVDTSILTIVVIGASGDLAKKKTYPSLFHLYCDQLIPHERHTLQIFGYARSPLTDEELRQRLRPYLLQSKMKHVTPETVDEFLQHCYYQAGTSYGDHTAYTEMIQRIRTFEEFTSATTTTPPNKKNRLFYFAIPPSAFAETGIVIQQTSMQDPSLGWTRLIVEKPFGRDLQSFETLNRTLSQYFHEDHIYRIDHYLGKELVQNLTVMRFSNIWLEKIWNNECIQSIILTFKEPFGTDGRGGYFDSYGIIRDILQNHLLQVLALLCMETPTAVTGPLSGKAIRDAKVAVLHAITPIALSDVVLGQYEGYAGTYICVCVCVVCVLLVLILNYSGVVTSLVDDDHFFNMLSCSFHVNTFYIKLHR